MKVRKIIATLVSVAVVISSIPVTAFAEEANVPLVELVPDASATVILSNSECLEYPNIKENLSLEMTRKSDGSIVAEIPLTTLSESEEDGLIGYWQGMEMDAFSNEIVEELAELQGELNFDEMLEDSNLEDDELEDAEDMVDDIEAEISAIMKNFDITVKGIPEGHYTVEAEVIVVTSEVMESVFSLIKELFVMMMQEENPEYQTPEKFSQLIEDFMEYTELSLGELMEEYDLEFDISEDSLKEVDEAVEFLCSDEFTGMVVANANLNCECPQTVEYEIVHEYYKVVNGKRELVGVVYAGDHTYGDEEAEEYYYEGKTGDLIKASDFINCEYEGTTYSYVGSYEYFDEYELEEFTLSLDWDAPYGLILRYEIEENTPEEVITDEKEDADKVVEEEEAEKMETAAPTGDYSNIMLYMVLLVVSVGIIGFGIAKKRK